MQSHLHSHHQEEEEPACAMGETPGSSVELGPTGPRRLWQCVYPGCREPPKTHYNCDSHVWDAHIRHQLPPDHPLAQFPYKRLPDRRAVKPLCSAYVVPVDNATSLRRPRDSFSSQNHQGDSFFETRMTTTAATTATTNSTTTTTTTMPLQQQQGQSQPQPMGTTTEYLLDEVPVVAGVRHEEPSYALDPTDIVRIVHMSPELARLHVCGEVFAERGFLQRSDARFKEDIAPIRGALERVLRLSGRTFRYRGDPTARTGFVAQELEAVVPTAVHRDAAGALSVDVPSLIPLLLEALKELHAQTLRSEAARAPQLRAALADALAQVDALNRKFDAYRAEHPTNPSAASPTKERENNTGHNSSGHNNGAGHGFDVDYEDGNDDFDDVSYDYESGESDIEAVFGKHHNGRTSAVPGAGNKGGVSSNSSDITTRKAGTEASLHYRFSFGPAVPVLLLGVFLVGAGFATCLFLPTMPFVWGYAWALGATLLLSLLGQGAELRSVLRGHEVPLYWTHANSINWLGAATFALLGATLTLILGMDSVFVCFFFHHHPIHHFALSCTHACTTTAGWHLHGSTHCVVGLFCRDPPQVPRALAAHHRRLCRLSRPLHALFCHVLHVQAFAPPTYTDHHHCITNH